jgi:LmbE family N-acetylglucosaminyl deacetylase
MIKKLLIFAASTLLLALPDAPAQQEAQTEGPQSKILVILAHPDDEFMMSGTVAMLSDTKADLTVVYATSGDAGLDVSGHGLKGDALAKTREEEVSSALKILGVKNAPIFLRYKDGHLPEVRGQLADKFTHLIADMKPEVVITFGPDGVTGHYDHIAVCSAVTEAFDDQKSTSCRTLLNFAVSNKRTDALKKCSNVDYVENFFEGVDSSSVNLVVDTGKYRQQRIDAFFIHYTQFNHNYRTAWVKFTADCPYEEFVIARMKGKFSSVSSFQELLGRKL